MKITIIGGGNMGGAIALALAEGKTIEPLDITVIDKAEDKIAVLKEKNSRIRAVTNNYSSLKDADIVIIGVKPWLVEEVLRTNASYLTPRQMIVSIAAGISLQQLSEWVSPDTPLYRIVPNTAVVAKESMTFISSSGTSEKQDNQIVEIFGKLGKTMLIDEALVPAVTSLSSCGIAYAFRYIRAAMEGGIEMGIPSEQAKDIIIQTLRGAIELLDANNSHPEAEIDKVTTPGGITIKGLNEMEHSGFSSAVIKGLKASFVK